MTATFADRLQGVSTAVAIKAPCTVATSANITLSGLQTIDGVAVVAGDRVLVKNQTAGAENGIYVAAAGDWTRALDWNGARDIVQGTAVKVINGSLNGNREYRVSTASPVVGTTAITLVTTSDPPVFKVENYGALGDGTTDDATAIQAAIDAAEAAGGGTVLFDAKTYAVAATLNINESHVLLQGSGMSDYMPTPTGANIGAAAATAIKGIDTFVGDELVHFETTGGYRKLGGGVGDMLINANGKCKSALKVTTWARGNFENLALVYGTEANLDLDVVITEILTAVPYDVQNCTFRNIYTGATNFPACQSAYGLRTNGFEDVGGVNGSAVAAAIGNPNVSFNYFENCGFNGDVQHGTLLIGATDNTFVKCGGTIYSDTSYATYRTWQLTAVEQDTRLTAMITKRNSWIQCGGRVWARAGQSGGRSSFGNTFRTHQTSVGMLYILPVVVEAAAGGSKAAEYLFESDEGDWTTRRLIAESADVRAKRQTIEEKAIYYDLDCSGGGSSKTATGIIPAGVNLKGISTRVTSILVGVTGYLVGDGSDTDRWGLTTAISVGTNTDGADFTTATPGGHQLAAGDVVITRNGAGGFTGGTIRICVYYEQIIAAHS